MNSFSLPIYRITIWNSTGTKLRGTIWAADTCQHSWTLKEAMSQPSEQITEANNPSHEELEYYSDFDSELEDGSTASEEDMFLSIWYPWPPYFPTPYLCNWDFRDPKKALKYITKHFNLEMIQKNVKQFPDLSHNFIYSNTFMDPDCFSLLKCYINKSICDHNALFQNS